MYYRVTTYSFDAARRDEWNAVDGLEMVHTLEAGEVIWDDVATSRCHAAQQITGGFDARPLRVRHATAITALTW